MVALPKYEHQWTEAEYLAFERTSETKHEYYDGQLYNMVGGSANHSQITANTIATFHIILRERPCRVYTSDLRVKLLRAYVYPDVTVVCGEPQLADQDTLLNPTSIIEVLSPSTAQHDRTTKWQRYQTLSTLQDYLLIAQDVPRLEHYGRQGEKQWLLTIYEGLEAVAELPSLAVRLPLVELYAKVDFLPEEAADADEGDR